MRPEGRNRRDKTMTMADVRNNRVALSTVGLDDEMIIRMTPAEISEYFTRDNFVAMFGECDLSDTELATWRMAAGGQKFLLENLDKI